MPEFRITPRAEENLTVNFNPHEDNTDTEVGVDTNLPPNSGHQEPSISSANLPSGDSSSNNTEKLTALEPPGDLEISDGTERKKDQDTSNTINTMNIQPVSDNKDVAMMQPPVDPTTLLICQPCTPQADQKSLPGPLTEISTGHQFVSDDVSTHFEPTSTNPPTSFENEDTSVATNSGISVDCPICLDTFQIDNSDSTPTRPRNQETSDGELDGEALQVLRKREEMIYGRSALTEQRRTLFRLTSCGHIMCRSCLRAYCASRVMDGDVNLRCCHPLVEEKTREEGERGDKDHPRRGGRRRRFLCDSPLADVDVRRILKSREMSMSSVSVFAMKTPVEDSQNQLLNLDGSVLESVEGDSSEEEAAEGNSKEVSSSCAILRRYERFKFDALHGDAARRCPKCDHARVFEMIEEEEQAGGEQNHLGLEASSPAETSSTAQNSNITGTGDGGVTDGDNTTLEQTASPSSGIRATIASPYSSTLGPHIRRRNFPSTGRWRVGRRRRRRGAGENDGEGAERGPFAPFTDGAHSNRTASRQRKPKTPVVSCESCDTEFCYYHSNAHVGETCEWYERRRRRAVGGAGGDDDDNDDSDGYALTMEYLRKSSKPCPKCGVLVQKLGGCNQMTCGACGTNFCWLCLATVDGGTFPTHFQWWNIGGCPNMQMHEGTRTPSGGPGGGGFVAVDASSSFDVFWSRAVALVQLVFIGIPSVVLAFVSSVLCCCLLPAVGGNSRERATNCVSCWGTVLTAAALLPVAIIWVVLVALHRLGSILLQSLAKVFCCKETGSGAAATDGNSCTDGKPRSLVEEAPTARDDIEGDDSSSMNCQVASPSFDESDEVCSSSDDDALNSVGDIKIKADVDLSIDVDVEAGLASVEPVAVA